ncbi:hypothetical protein [Granulicella sibirica]|nr:hypothetical protein [Granulicella sibirica]
MRKRLAMVALGLLALPGLAKSKKIVLPAYVLKAHTVAVLIDPDAGIAYDDPRANQVAQKDVETALLKWGRFEPVISTQDADLIIVVRRGTGKLVDQTIADPRQNNRPGMIDPTSGGLAVGGQRGRPLDASDSGQPSASPTGVHPQTEVGATDDSFVVYEGKVEGPLEHPAAWRYTGRDGLRPHGVPAVDEFRKMVAEAEKAASKNP